MPLSQKKLNTLASHRKICFTPLREFENDPRHPVVLMHQSHAESKEQDGGSWMTLMCPCDLKWRWTTLEVFPVRRTMVMTGNWSNCPSKEAAREVVRTELRREYLHPWMGMSLAEAVEDIWARHKAGAYMGEHNVGMLYVQDVERLLGTTPDVMHVYLCERKNGKGEIVSGERVVNMSAPSKKILSAISELQQKKLVDLNGMILIPYVEYFRLPDALHRQFAYWIEEPLGWPNGEAGDCFLSALCAQVAKATGWKSGDDVFGPENIPILTPAWRLSVPEWIRGLDERLAVSAAGGKGAVLREIAISRWVDWLVAIKREVVGMGSE